MTFKELFEAQGAPANGIPNRVLGDEKPTITMDGKSQPPPANDALPVKVPTKKP